MSLSSGRVRSALAEIQKSFQECPSAALQLSLWENPPRSLPKSLSQADGPELLFSLLDQDAELSGMATW